MNLQTATIGINFQPDMTGLQKAQQMVQQLQQQATTLGNNLQQALKVKANPQGVQSVTAAFKQAANQSGQTNTQFKKLNQSLTSIGNRAHVTGSTLTSAIGGSRSVLADASQRVNQLGQHLNQVGGQAARSGRQMQTAFDKAASGIHRSSQALTQLSTDTGQLGGHYTALIVKIDRVNQALTTQLKLLGQVNKASHQSSTMGAKVKIPVAQAGPATGNLFSQLPEQQKAGQKLVDLWRSKPAQSSNNSSSGGSLPINTFSVNSAASAGNKSSGILRSPKNLISSHLPKIKLPKFHLPKFKLPKIHLPKLKLPKISFGAKQAGLQLGADMVSSGLKAPKGKLGATVGGTAGGELGSALGSMTPLGPLGGVLGGAAGSMLGSKAGAMLDKNKSVAKGLKQVKKDGKKIAKGVQAAWKLITKGPKSKQGNAAKKYLDRTFGKFAPTIKHVTTSVRGGLTKLGKAFNVILAPLKKFGTWLGKTFGTAFKQIGKTVGPVFKDIGHALSSMGSALSSAIQKYFGGKNGGIAKSVANTLGAIINFAKPMIKTLLSVVVGGFKILATGVRVVIDIVKNIFDSSIGSWVKAFKNGLATIGDVFKLFKDVFTGNWKDIGKDIGNIASDLWKTVKSVFEAGINMVIGVVNSALDGINWLLKKLPKSVTHNLHLHIKPVHFAVGTKGKYPQGLPHPMLAKVNDGGAKELILMPNGRGIVPQRMNTTMYLPAGAHVLNGADTKRVLGSTQHFATGTVQLASTGPTAKADLKLPNKKLDAWTKHSKQAWDTTAKNTVKSVKSISSDTTNGYQGMTKKLGKTNDSWANTNYKDWKSITSDTDKQTTLISKNTISDYNHLASNMQSTMNGIYKNTSKQYQRLRNNLADISNAIYKDWKATWTTVTDFFNTQFGKLGKYAHNGMSGAISSLNSGIKGIDTVLSKFGGNSTVIPAIHYAEGSKGPIANNQIAVVNDAKTGPRQEAILRGSQYIMPKGNDVQVALRKGDQVLNGTQTQRLANAGMLPHYAKGTMSDSALTELADKSHSHPDKAWSADFDSNVKSSGFDLQKGITTTGKSAADSVGKPWYKAAWDVINDAIDGGGASNNAFLNYAIKISKGHNYVLGTHGPSTFDCSGLVMATAEHFGLNLPAPSGSQFTATKPVASPKAGDLVFYGANGSQHVGIYSGGNRFWSAKTDSNPVGQQIGYGPVHGFGESFAGFRHIPGVSSGDSKKKGSKGLESLFQKELGSKAMGWITNHLGTSMSGGQGSGPKPTGSHLHWLKQAGIPESWFSSISEIIQAESNWDVHASNGQYQGIPQTTVGNLAAAGSDWRDNPITQLRAMKTYIEGRYTNANNALSFRHGHNWYANGGWSNKPAIFGEVPGQPEIAINPARNTADKHIMEAITARIRKAPASPIARLFNGAQELINQGFDTGRSVKPLAPKRQKAANTRPSIKVDYHPQITIKVDGNGDVKAQAKSIARELVQQMFKELRQDYDPGTTA